MPRKPKCKCCKRIVAKTNRKGHCLNCAVNKNNAVVRQLKAKKGKYYRKWKRNLINSLKHI